MALAGGAAVVVAAALSAVSGQLSSGILAGFDPGVLVRYGLPMARALRDFLAAVTVGSLVLAAWVVAPGPGTPPVVRRDPRLFLARLGAVSAGGWFVVSLTGVVLTAAEVAGVDPASPDFALVVASFVTQVDLGRSLLVSAALVAVALVVALVGSGSATLAWAAVFSLLALAPISLAGHASGGADHMNAVDSLAFHVVGVTVWVGGLAALLLVVSRLGDQAPKAVARYSVLAGWCYLAVAGSGVVNAYLRLGSPANLGTSYGLLVLGKTAALVLLGAAGWLHRRKTIPGLGVRPRLFLRLASAEVVVMGATLGLGVALSRSAPPGGPTPDPVEALLGFPLPPPLTPATYLTVFHPSVLWLTVAAVLAGAYIAGVSRLSRHGVPWPWYRTVSWVGGCLTLVFVTSGGAGVYARVHFSAHMVQHMALMMVVPLLLVPGAPLTLAFRALQPRADGSFGLRETLLALVHSRALRVLANPVVAATLLSLSLVVFYYSPLFDLALFTHTGHVLMTVHFLLSGYLFVWSLVGVDPGPDRPPYPLRLIVLFVTISVHAFFGISLMSAGTLLAPSYWLSLGQTDTAALLADQQVGGGIAWGAGDLPSFVIVILLTMGWVRSDARRARQLDRQADRDGDAALRHYNEQLAQLSRVDTAE